MNYRKVLPVIVIRFFANLTFLIQPFIGFFISNFFDATDVILMTFMGIKLTNRQYQIFDKTMDNMLLLVEFISIFIFNFIPAPYLPFAIFLFIWRICGSTLALITKKREILLFTPNFFMFYAVFFAFLQFFNIYSVLDNQVLTNVIIAVLFAKNLGQEIVLHVIKLHPWDWSSKKLGLTHRFIGD